MDDNEIRAGAPHLTWTMTRLFNPGFTYVHRDDQGRMVWIISEQPDGSLWQLGSNPDLVAYGEFTLHETASHAMAAAEEWTMNHG